MTASSEAATLAQPVAGDESPAEEVWRPDARGWAARIGVLVAVFGFLAYLLATVSQTWANLIAQAAIYAIIGLSLNVILGYTGQVSLGHHGFVGVAAFVSAGLVSEQGQTFWVGLGAAVLTGAATAGLLGLGALRIKGLYLALITLTFGFVAANSIFEIPALTRGGQGMPAPRPEGFTTNRSYALLCILILAVAIFVDWRIVRSKVGRAILAVKQSEAVASSYAVNVTFYKAFAFILSGAFAGLAGSLFAHRVGVVVANNFRFENALLWVLMVVVGGLGRRTGVVIASAFFALFPALISEIEFLRHFIEETLNREPDYFTLVIGSLLALEVIIFAPGGLGGRLSPLTTWLGGAKFSMHPEGGGHHKKARAGEGRRDKLMKRLGLDRDSGTAAESEPEAADDAADDAHEDSPPTEERPAP
ncbi:MAG TPA: branched-chain amino acid ABC transporter permease [Actinomycetota bacterium]|nr:branched-chain amino acid ABC transporter permease [Actinomycetota bacterium]